MRERKVQALSGLFLSLTAVIGGAWAPLAQLIALPSAYYFLVWIMRSHYGGGWSMWGRYGRGGSAAAWRAAPWWRRCLVIAMLLAVSASVWRLSYVIARPDAPVPVPRSELRTLTGELRAQNAGRYYLRTAGGSIDLRCPVGDSTNALDQAIWCLPRDLDALIGRQVEVRAYTVRERPTPAVVFYELRAGSTAVVTYEEMATRAVERLAEEPRYWIAIPAWITAFLFVGWWMVTRHRNPRSFMRRLLGPRRPRPLLG